MPEGLGISAKERALERVRGAVSERERSGIGIARRPTPTPKPKEARLIQRIGRGLESAGAGIRGLPDPAIARSREERQARAAALKQMTDSYESIQKVVSDAGRLGRTALSGGSKAGPLLRGEPRDHGVFSSGHGRAS
jgi:hypothetical protein